MNERERGICSRVREIWKLSKWPLPEFAKAIGISRNQLANIVYGRAPLRVRDAIKICHVFEANAEWIVTNRGPVKGCAPLPVTIRFEPSWYSQLLSEAYDRDPECFMPVPEGSKMILDKPSPGFDAQTFLIKEVISWFQLNNFNTPLDSEIFARDVADFAQTMLQVNRERWVSTRILKQKHSKESLDKLFNFPDASPVQNKIRNLKELIAHLKEVTAARGAKSALAKEFGVTRQAVNQWLSGESAPSADIAIRLQYWKAKPAK